MNVNTRRYQSEADYWRMRDFLRRLYVPNDRRLLAWHVARLDYARWHVCLNVAEVQFADVVHLWETGNHIVGIMMPDGGPGEAHPMIHPAQRNAGIETQMLNIAQKSLARTNSNGFRELSVWVPREDASWQSRLAANGYELRNTSEHQWRRDLDGSLPETPLPEGYQIRPLGDGLELLERY